MDFRVFFFLSSLMLISVAAHMPTKYPFDCRLPGVECQNSGTCQLSNGSCSCIGGFEGYDCGLNTTSVLQTCPETSTCQYNADCITGGNCICGMDTYGDTCSNPRLRMWCNGTYMIINIYPHGDDSFDGIIFLRDQEDEEDCTLQKVDESVDLLQYDFVRDVYGRLPALEGYYTVLETDATNPSPCLSSSWQDTNDTTDLVQSVILQYNAVIMSSLDQRIEFRCSITNTNLTVIETGNVMSVTIESDDYKPLNVTEKIEPIQFETRNPVTGSVITNDVNLGDPLDLVIFLSSETSQPNGIQEIKVVSCTASSTSATLLFLDNDCPTLNSKLAYRDSVEQNEARTITTIPLVAFRFVGNSNEVSITCSVKLCYDATLQADPLACTKNDCEGDTSSGGESTTTNSGGSGNGGTTASPSSTSTDSNNNQPPSSTTASQPGSRRKRSVTDDNNEREVSRTINVVSGVQKASTDTQREEDSMTEDEDCMQHSEVVIIIVIFTGVLMLLVVVVVLLGVSLLRSRKKVVDASDVTTVDTQSRYTLPRLSLATTM